MIMNLSARVSAHAVARAHTNKTATTLYLWSQQEVLSTVIPFHCSHKQVKYHPFIIGIHTLK